MQLLKHIAIGTDVTAVQVTVDNVHEVAELTGGHEFTSPRDSTPYVVIETDEGSKRLQPGLWLVRYEDESFDVMDDRSFHAVYARP